MIYITGDCHGEFEKFDIDLFPEQKEMTKEDFMIICGDFGGIKEILKTVVLWTIKDNQK